MRSFRLLLILLTLCVLPAHAANRYWVGGGSSANWNATGNTNWGSASNTQDNVAAPTSGDDVFFDGVGTGASNSTLNTAFTIRSLNMTGYANTLTHSAAVTLSIGDATAGASNVALKFPSGMTYTLGNSNTSAITFTSSSATQQTIDFAGKTVGTLTFSTTGQNYLFSSGFTQGASSSFIFTRGTLDLNGQTITTNLFSGTAANTRVFTCGAANITVNSGNVGAWDWATVTGLTFSCASATISMAGTAGGFKGGGLTYGTVSFGGTGTHVLTGNNTFSTLTLNAGRTFTFPASGTQTITTTLNCAGSAGNVITINSSTGGTAASLSKASGTVSCDYLNLTDSAATGGASFYAGANSTNVSGNTGWTFTAPPAAGGKRKGKIL